MKYSHFSPLQQYIIQEKDFLNLNAKDFYLKHFPNAESTEYWVGRKNLYVYSENTEQEVIDDLLSLLKAINTNQ